MASQELQRLWPLFGLRVRCGDLELRVPDDDDVADLAELARQPIHPAGQMPFLEPWSDVPDDERVRRVLQWHWRSRAEWTPTDWRLNLVVCRRATVVGTQGIHARSFAVTREVETGSWLGRCYQGQGIGTAMRRAVLHLAFAGMGADTARSGAFSDNAASIRVSDGLGYARDGTFAQERRGTRATVTRFVLTRDEWARRSRQWPSVTVEGLDACRAELGLGEAPAWSRDPAAP